MVLLRNFTFSHHIRGTQNKKDQLIIVPHLSDSVFTLRFIALALRLRI